MSQNSRSESAIFRAAVELPEDERPAYLDQACGENRPLRQEVESLLQAHDPQASFLQAPAPAVTIDRPITERPGTQIGPYKLMEQIGEGGFGLVFVAEQHQPVRRKVALKVIKPGMDTREVVARFEAERQALAMMDHPHIAKVLDAGTTDSGRPYFVMELVRGIPITDYCDQNQLSPRERLPLFIAVCQAVQHAHQKGVIHRDLKPNNILVAPHDGIPVVKVIDFGVAKALGQQLTDKTIYTRFAQFIGTPLYMSPEQAEINALDVDTRSDVYSLGVLLYELITGTTPFDKQRLASAAFDEIRRIIREEDPPTMCARLAKTNRESRNTDIPGTPGRSGGTNLKSKIQNLKSIMELDWIVMKCLEKDRTRRYETANNLARDVQRYLADEPVEACPPSLTYRLSKVARRYKAPLAVAAGFVALLLAGIAVSAWQAVRATTAERLAAASEDKALANAKSARDSEQIAKQERDAADLEKNNALAAREELRHTLYASEMNQIQTAAENKQFRRVAQLLDQQRPAAGQPDLRGVEWHYWQRRLQRSRLRSVEVPQLGSMDPLLSAGQTPRFERIFSQNGERLAAIVEYPGDSPSQSGIGLVAVFDGATGHELVAPLEPFPTVTIGGTRQLLLAMSDDGKRLATAVNRRSASTDERPGRFSIRDGGTGQEIHSIECPGIVKEMALSADGSRIAIAYVELGAPIDSRRTGVKVWDTSTGELVQTLPMHPLYSPSLDRILWSPDGMRLLRQSVSRESTDNAQVYRSLFQIVDVASGEELWKRNIDSRANPHRAWSWSPDGKLLVIFEVAQPGTLAKHNAQLWDCSTGTTLAILDRESASSPYLNSNIDFSPDGQRLAVASDVNEIYVWELPKLPAAGAAPLHIAAPNLTLQAAEEIHALAFSADGRELRCVAGTSIVTWDATAREDRGLGPDPRDGSVTAAAISADVTKVAFQVGSTNPKCSVWDLAKNQEVCRLKTLGTRAGRPVFSPDGRRVALTWYANIYPDTPQDDLRIVIHDAQTGEVTQAIHVEQTTWSRVPIFATPVFRPDGGQIAAVISPNVQLDGRGPARLMVWDVATGEQKFSVVVSESSSSVADSRNPGSRNPGVAYYSLDGASLMVPETIGRSEGAAVFYDATTGDWQGSTPLPSAPSSYFIDVRHQLFGANVRSDSILWDLATGHERLRLPGFNGGNYAVSPDASRVVLTKYLRGGASESELTLWSLKSGRQLLSFNRQGTVSAVSFSPDGHRLVAAFSRSGSSTLKPIQIWDATPLPEK